MHLADAFIQSDLHCILSYSFTFDQLLLSLGIEPMILALLAPCSTIWATGKQEYLGQMLCELGHSIYLVLFCFWQLMLLSMLYCTQTNLPNKYSDIKFEIYIVRRRKKESRKMRVECPSSALLCNCSEELRNLLQLSLARCLSAVLDF